MFTSELSRGVIALGSSQVLVLYPRKLADWFRYCVIEKTNREFASPWVKIYQERSSSEHFRVISSDGHDDIGLELSGALAAFFERVTFLLIDQLNDALALHAAAVRVGDRFVLLPGSSGLGKTQLALWYRAQGFVLDTDELVSVSATPARTLIVAALARPLFLKPTSPSALVPTDELRIKHGAAGAEILLTANEMRPPQAIEAGCIVFPQFQAGSPLQLEALTPAQACVRLLQHCVNVRNLPSGGLMLAAATARQLPALSLRYGATEQLSGTLDVITHQLLAMTPNTSDLVELCNEFTARSASKHSLISALSSQCPSMPSTKPMPTTQASRRLTIGMASFDEYDGVYFTIQSIRFHHPEVANAIEFIVIDNNPGGPCSEALQKLEDWIDGYRYVARGDWHGTAIRNAIFEEASCEIVMCVDAHILIAPGALARLLDYCNATPGSRDLLQGPLLYDDLRSIATHFEPNWRAGMYGTWAFDERGNDPGSPPFSIPMQGLGLFACRREAWPHFNPSFRGFGGEEGYIHEKIRQRGGRTLCLPFLRWVHRFSRPLGTPYANRWEDRVRNYYVGFTELGLSTSDMENHFAELIGAESVRRIIDEERAKNTLASSPLLPGASDDAGQSESWPYSAGVYSPHHYSFGDQWASINFYLNMSVVTQERIRLASIINNVDLHDLHRDILNELESPGQIELVRSEPSIRLNTYNVWQSSYFPTRTRWHAYRRHKYVAVQFDGESAKELKNASPEEAQMIQTFIERMCPGFTLVRLGKPLSVKKCVEIAANSAFFVGVDSGMSHLCHSVGVPIFLLEYRLPVHTTHGGKAYTLCRGFGDFTVHFDRYANYLNAIDAPDAKGMIGTRHEQALPMLLSELQEASNEGRNLKQVAHIPDIEGVNTARVEQGGGEPAEQQARIRRVLSLLTPQEVIGSNKIRIGRQNDGGYVLIDEERRTRVCYSFGIGLDASWDYEMAIRGAIVYQYDHNLAKPPQQHPSFRFYSIGVGPVSHGNIKTIQDLIAENGHATEDQMILKMDIEGAEWDILDQVSLPLLKQFVQIIVELHGMSEMRSKTWCARAERVLLKLSQSHVPVHVHGNNFSLFDVVEGIPVPQVVEVTFARRSSYSTRAGSVRFPTDIDQPNNPDVADLYLSRFEF
ncbi:MAG: FkbM family methyltransferase [Beijerinckiaceae bacterium]|nr:FkbM family methyltransferase [Beijerinckiaceae bacterium]